MAHSDDEQSTFLLARFDPTGSAACFTLSVVHGPDEGTQWQLDASRPSRSLVGVGPACDVRLTDRTVSRRHAALELEDDRLRISDLGSKNGSFVDGTRIVEAFVVGGETLQIGATRFLVTRNAPTSVALPEQSSFGRMLGVSTEMRRLYALCARLAQLEVPLIIEGETGTGKELLAECLHEASPRAGGPFVIFDCTTVPPNIMESELFGHERGAFTGASATRKGLFEQADGGTLFIDEIGDLDIALQAKLLRAIERYEIRPVGSNTMRRVSVRIIAATRRDLDREVQENRFRDDLYHRLAVARIELPPLRRRRGDVWLLSRRFAEDLGMNPDALPPKLLARWDRDDWPGNVRELRNAVARTLLLGELASHGTLEDPSTLDEMPDPFEQVLAMGLPLQEARERIVLEFSRRYVERALADAGGNVTHAARSSGVTRRYLQMLRAKVGQ